MPTAVDYGFDMSCLFDLTPLMTEVTGRQLLIAQGTKAIGT